ncbi:MAG: hypothetical protein FWE95_05080 [Planctomycetaceae bacterium]|nr:hypothetical protein [Planctomycetaceae bacterium]
MSKYGIIEQKPNHKEHEGITMKRFVFAIIFLLTTATLLAEDAMIHLIQSDWEAQERRLGREPESRKAIEAAVDRIEKLLGSSNDKLAAYRKQCNSFDSLPAMERMNLYESVRFYGRDIALSTIPDTPILFLKQRRFICQMLHEFVGYYYDFGGVVGGGIYILEEPGKSFKIRSLTEGLLPQGAFATPALSYDGKTVYFAFCEVKEHPRPFGTFNHWRRLPDARNVPPEFNWKSPDRTGFFHIYAINVDGTNLRQLTSGNYDDFDPCPLPDGGIAFMSSRRGDLYNRCSNGFEPLPTQTLHRMDTDGQNIRPLSRHETDEWNPSVLNDGRIVYSRWDYVDRSAAHFHGLWAGNPDGTAPVVLFGNYTMELSIAFQPRAIPNSNKIAFIAGAHHANIGGSLVLFDPAKAKYDPITGEDCFSSLERLTPEVVFPETSEGWPTSFYSSPLPLSEDRFLVAFSYQPLPSMDYIEDSKSGLYYYDRFGNMELLYRDPEISSVFPIPLQARPIPPWMASALDPVLAAEHEGEFLLTDVNWSLFPFPENRPVKTLRIFEVLPKVGSHVANNPKLGYANAESARRYLGEVPVDADGSAFFRAPAELPLYFQAVDAEGKAVQSMRSITYLQPGERRSCTGCHEPIGAVPQAMKTAMLREPSRMTPGPSGSNPMSFPLLVQPVLDRNCLECHETWTGARERGFSVSYNKLEPFVRWYEWGDKSISQIVTRPGEVGADMSPLTKILKDANHKAMYEKMSEEDKRRIYLWLDANAPFYGAYE